MNQNQKANFNREVKQLNGLNQETNDIDMCWFFKVRISVNEIVVNGLHLQEIRSEIFGEYTGVFEMIVDTVIGEHE